MYLTLDESTKQLILLALQDYKGQKLAEQIFQGIILVSAVRTPDMQ